MPVALTAVITVQAGRALPWHRGGHKVVLAAGGAALMTLIVTL